MTKSPSPRGRRWFPRRAEPNPPPGNPAPLIVFVVFIALVLLGKWLRVW